MKKTLIALTVAVIMIAQGLPGHSRAGENIAPKGAAATEPTGASKKSVADEKKDEEAAKAAAEEAKKAAELEKKAAEEAKKIIVAKVNGVGINMFMLTRAMNRVAPQYVKAGEDVTPETTAKIKSEALDNLIIEELAVQQAIKQGINPRPEAIDKVIAQVRKNLATEQAYNEYLDRNNLTEDALRKMIERSQRLELITAKEVYKKVKVDEKLLKDEYEKEKSKYILPENFVVEDVWFIKGKKDEAARKHAEDILKMIRSEGNDPNKLILDGTFIVRNAAIVKQRYPEIYKAMTDMKVGDLSGIIDEKDGLHIIKVNKKEPSRQATFEEARPSIEPKLVYPVQEQRRQQWEKELRENAKIEILTDESEKK